MALTYDIVIIICGYFHSNIVIHLYLVQDRSIVKPFISIMNASYVVEGNDVQLNCLIMENADTQVKMKWNSTKKVIKVLNNSYFFIYVILSC